MCITPNLKKLSRDMSKIHDELDKVEVDNIVNNFIIINELL